MAGTKNRRNRRMTGGRRRTGGLPRWGLVLAGVALGMLAMGAVMFFGKSFPGWLRPDGEPAPESAPAPSEKPSASRPKAPDAPAEKRFEFYEVLPNAEVVIPQDGAEAKPDATPAPVTIPGVYVLQAGSFGTFAEADRMKARLALLGIRSQIQNITVEGREFHRVRIEPIEDLDLLNRTRQRLRNAKIDALLIRVGE